MELRTWIDYHTRDIGDKSRSSGVDGSKKWGERHQFKSSPICPLIAVLYRQLLREKKESEQAAGKASEDGKIIVA
jgi:hypothetical protein